MKKNGYKALIGIFAGAAFGLVSASASAAENAAGVKEHMGLFINAVKEAADHANQGHGDLCTESIKKSIQHYKEITGDAAGKPLQDAVKKIKAAKDACQAGDTAEASAVLSSTIPDVEKINAGIK